VTVNLVTDVLPAVAIAVQDPEHRDLSRLAREEATGLDRPSRNDLLWRGIATAAPRPDRDFSRSSPADHGELTAAAAAG
jgi:hypothetical protein